MSHCETRWASLGLAACLLLAACAGREQVVPAEARPPVPAPPPATAPEAPAPEAAGAAPAVVGPAPAGPAAPAVRQAPPAARTAPAKPSPPAPPPAAPAKASVTPPVAAPVPAPTKPAAPTAVTKVAPAPATPSLDLGSLETRLRQTKAIGTFTKLSLKNQVDDLLAQFRAYYKGQARLTLPQLRQSYELLLMKVLAVLQDGDPALAKAIVASREAIWSILSDPKKFTEAKLMAGEMP